MAGKPATASDTQARRKGNGPQKKKARIPRTKKVCKISFACIKKKGCATTRTEGQDLYLQGYS
jgi:hypothetical protein